MSKSIEIDDVTENFGEEKHLIFGYTPTCGTCKVSERMLDIANEILKLPVKKIDMNFHPKFSETHQISFQYIKRTHSMSPSLQSKINELY